MKIIRVFVSEYPGKQVGDVYDIIDSENHPGSILSGIIKEVELPEELHAEEARHLIATIGEDGEISFSVDTVKKAADVQAAQAEALRQIIIGAEAFGKKLSQDFKIENVVLGITQDGMTGTVLDKMSRVMAALDSGSLHEAISRIKAIPEADKDAKYITDARLLEAANKLEAYLGLPLSTEL